MINSMSQCLQGIKGRFIQDASRVCSVLHTGNAAPVVLSCVLICSCHMNHVVLAAIASAIAAALAAVHGGSSPAPTG